MPGAIVFLTAATNTLAERVRFAQAGQLGIGGANFGTAGQVLTSGGASSPPTWSAVSAAARPVSTISGNTTAVNNYIYNCTATLTLTLPASPTAGMVVGVINKTGFTVTIGRNAVNIMSLAQDLTIDTLFGVQIDLTYIDATVGWSI
jgi:hypothetical protein